MKIRASTIILWILFVVGMLILNYPALSNLYNRLHEGEVLSSHEQALQGYGREELERQRELARQYNQKLFENEAGVFKDTFPAEGATWDKEYESLLNINNDGVMGGIEIPKIHLYLSIYHGISETVLSHGVGHMDSTSLPVGEENTHSVLSAHRGLPSAELFTNLDQVEEGDVFYLHILKETYAYQVDQVVVMLPEEISQLEIEAGQDYVTLLTCTPYGINSHRLLVRGTRIPYEEPAEDEITKIRQSVWNWLLEQKTLLLSLLLLVLLFIAAIVRAVIKKRKRRSIRQPENKGGDRE